MTLAAAVGADAEEPSLAIPRASYEASLNGLQSGVGSGALVHSERPLAAGGAWQELARAAVEFSWVGRKYHVQLDYQHEPLNTKRRVIVYDGDAILSARFSDSISRSAAEGRVYDPGPDRSLVRPRLSEFPWDVTRLATNVVNVPAVLDKAKTRKLEHSLTESGDVLWDSRVDETLHVLYEFPAANGNNVSLKKVVSAAQSQPPDVFEVKWGEAHGLWYVTDITRTFRVVDKMRRESLVIDQFEPNAKVDPALFT